MSEKRLYEDFSPDDFHNIQLKKTFYLTMVPSDIQRCVMNVESFKGGAEYNILQFCDCGVQLWLCTISGMVFGDFKDEKN